MKNFRCFVGLLVIHAVISAATPGINIWDLTTAIDQDLNSHIEVVNSEVEGLFSAVEGLDSRAQGAASSFDSVCSVALPEYLSAVDTFVSAGDRLVSLIDEMQSTDLPRIESKIDLLPSLVDQALSADFVATLTLAEAVESQLDKMNSAVSGTQSSFEVAISLFDGLGSEGINQIASSLDICDSLFDTYNGCNSFVASALPSVASQVELLGSDVASLVSLVDGPLADNVAQVVSAIDYAENAMTVAESSAEVVSSGLDSTSSLLDMLVTGSSPCASQFIKQSDFTLIAGENVLTLNSGAYCLAEDIVGRITFPSFVGNIIIDLNGHTLSNPSFVSAIDMYVQGSVRVSNGFINGSLSVKNSGAIVLEDLQVTGGGTTGRAIVVDTCNAITINRCLLEGASSAGLYIAGASLGTRRPSVVENVTITGCAGRGIDITQVAWLTIQNCLIQQCGQEGIACGDLAGSVIENVSIIECDAGIVVNAADLNDLIISECFIGSNNGIGIQVVSSGIPGVKDVTIANNAIMDNAVAGISVDACSRVFIAGNYVGRTTGSTGAGIVISNTTTGEIDGNTLISNAGAGIDVSAAVSDFSIAHNDMINNSGINLVLGTNTNKIITSNKMHTAAMVIGGTGYNFDIVPTPYIEWSRGSSGIVSASSGVLTSLANWSSIG